MVTAITDRVLNYGLLYFKSCISPSALHMSAAFNPLVSTPLLYRTCRVLSLNTILCDLLVHNMVSCSRGWALPGLTFMRLMLRTSLANALCPLPWSNKKIEGEAVSLLWILELSNGNAVFHLFEELFLSHYPSYLAPIFKKHCATFHSPVCESFCPLILFVS